MQEFVLKLLSKLDEGISFYMIKGQLIAKKVYSEM
jgi:hypothetical protein